MSCLWRWSPLPVRAFCFNGSLSPFPLPTKTPLLSFLPLLFEFWLLLLLLLLFLPPLLDAWPLLLLEFLLLFPLLLLPFWPLFEPCLLSLLFLLPLLDAWP